MKKVRLLTAILMTLSGMAVVQVFLFREDKIPIPPSRSAAVLAAVSDTDIEALVVNDLSRQLLTQYLVPARWKTMTPPAREVWALNTVWGAIAEEGLDEFLANHGRAPPEPGLADAAESCVAMGLMVPAKLFRALDGNPDPQAIRRLLMQLRAALATPEVRARRVAYVRKHLEEFPEPFRSE